jgi:hypothetical protein
MNESLYCIMPLPVKQMSAAQLRSYFPVGEYTKAYLMRSIIMNEKQFYRGGEDRTLRGVWYAVVKPTLDKLGLLTSDDQTEEGLTAWDATLSNYMGDLLRKGLLLYSDLGIHDTSRQKRNPSISYFTSNVQTYGYQASAAPYPNIIIATEKDTVYNIISGMAQLLGCSCISAKGQNALGAMEMLVKGVVNDRRYKGEKTIYILSMTDYDPAGYYIAGALRKQAEDILIALGEEYNWTVEDARIGIEPDQLDPDIVRANMYTPKPANLEKWFDLTGGIDGEMKGLELDALSSKQIRDIFATNIEQYIDRDVYIEFIKRAYVKMKFLEQLKPAMDAMFTKYLKDIEDIIVVDSAMDILGLARTGYSYIPVSNYCAGFDSEAGHVSIDDAMQAYLDGTIETEEEEEEDEDERD